MKRAILKIALVLLFVPSFITGQELQNIRGTVIDEVLGIPWLNVNIRGGEG